MVVRSKSSASRSQAALAECAYQILSSYTSGGIEHIVRENVKRAHYPSALLMCYTYYADRAAFRSRRTGFKNNKVLFGRMVAISASARSNARRTQRGGFALEFDRKL